MLLIVGAIVALATFGLQLGIDFTGGTVWEVEFQETVPTTVELTEVLDQTIEGEVLVSPTGDTGFLIRTGDIDEETHQALLSSIQGQYGAIIEQKFEAIGPVIGDELKQKSIRAIIVVLIVIVLYIALVLSLIHI